MLLWFFGFLLFFYFFTFSFLIPMLFSSLKVRTVFFEKLLSTVLSYFRQIFSLIQNDFNTYFFPYFINIINKIKFIYKSF
jgi:hypothetical protein